VLYQHVPAGFGKIIATYSKTMPNRIATPALPQPSIHFLTIRLILLWSNFLGVRILVVTLMNHSPFVLINQ
jgi:hypothetical protein